MKSTRATTGRTGEVGPAENDTDDKLEDATEAESAALVAADTTEIHVEDAIALLGADDDDDQGDEKGVYSPDPNVRLIRNAWTRKGVMERVRGVKYMWGLFACNELLRRRFGMLESASCSCCPMAGCRITPVLASWT